MENMQIYEKVRQVPAEAKKNIGGGRLKGMTDINPMWRIKTLTEQFGPCGIGWFYEITDRWIETTMAKDEITANVMINLYVKDGKEWSKPIQGIGGSMLVASERAGLYVNDECYKMALTDAISVACKALGVGADVYWQKDNTKYNDSKKANMEEPKRVAPKNAQKKAPEPSGEIDERALWKQLVVERAKEQGIKLNDLAKEYKLNADTTPNRFKEVYEALGA